jgi:hypothetical protein
MESILRKIEQDEDMSIMNEGTAINRSTSSDTRQTSTTINSKMDTQKLACTATTLSAIHELQSAFSSILLASKRTDPVKESTNFWSCSMAPKRPAPKTILVPEQTSFFALFCFPRELRDKIYFHYLHRPQGITYYSCAIRPSRRSEHSDSLTPLFLSNRQIYHEALEVFGRYNRVRIRSRNEQYYQRYSDHKTLSGTLRLFPDTYAQLLQRVDISFEQYVRIPGWRTSDVDFCLPNEAFVQVLRDGYVFKNTFPKLREFSIVFSTYHGFFGQAVSNLLAIEGTGQEEKVDKCVSLMRIWMGKSNIVPPRWVRFMCDDHWKHYGLVKQDRTWNEAYKRLVRDVETKHASLEVSEEIWIEEKCRCKRKSGSRYVKAPLSSKLDETAQIKRAASQA